MSVSTLDARRSKILGLVVTSYIETAKPVGSSYISKKLKSSLSSATIRNIMAELEDDGYLAHIHTSSGRIPTQKGFRFYVDSLRQLDRISRFEMDSISREFEERKQALEDIIKKTSYILSSLTKQAGVVLFPRLKRSFFKRVELVFIEPKKILAVLVTSSGLIRDVVIELETRIKREDLDKISVFLNSEIEGMSISEAKRHLLGRLEAQKDSLSNLFKSVFEIIRLSLLFNETERLHIDGITNIIEQPDFRNIDKARQTIRSLEEKLELYDILDDNLSEKGLKVYIGNECCRSSFNELSLITSTYNVRGELAGLVGVIGPTRMNYGRIIPIVEHLSTILSERLM